MRDRVIARWLAKEAYNPHNLYLPPELRGTEPLRPEGTDLAVYTYESHDVPYALVFAGKQTKPLWHHRFRSEQARQQYIDKTIEDRKARIQAVKERMEKRKQERAEFQHGIKVGDIFYSSWGYDQTNISWFQVIKADEKSVVIREISSRTVRQETGTDYVMPVKDHFKGPPERKIPRPAGGKPALKVFSFAYAYPWDGQPKSQTAWGYGH